VIGWRSRDGGEGCDRWNEMLQCDSVREERDGGKETEYSTLLETFHKDDVMFVQFRNATKCE
jgi:hypothetical protein